MRSWTQPNIQQTLTTRDEVEYQGRVYDALDHAKTWGKFRETLPSEELDHYPDFKEMFEEHDPDEPFNSEHVYGVGDGDYPPSLAYTIWSGECPK